MRSAESIALDVAQLVDGVEERAEYAEMTIRHTPECEAYRARLRDGVPFREDGAPVMVAGKPVYEVEPEPGRFRHHACRCPRRIVPRGRTVHDGALLWQLTAVAAMVGGQAVPGEAIPAGSPWDDDGALSPSRGGGFESRPPVSDAVLLADEIASGVAALYARLRRAAGLPPGGRRSVAGQLRELVTLASDVDERTAERAARRVRSWTHAARARLKYEARMIRLDGTVCGECGGDLIVAADASTDVVCVGGTVAGPAPEGEDWPVAYDGCGQRYPRSSWVDLLDAS